MPAALKVFQELRVHGRLKRAEMTQILATMGLKQADLLPYLRRERLISDRRILNGGFFFPSK